MTVRSRWRLWLAIGLAAAVALVAVLLIPKRPADVAGGGGDAPLRPDEKTYREVVAAFFSGVAALDADAIEQARADLTRATELVPGEPAAWANRGLLEIRQNEYEAALRDLERARALSPDNAGVERLLGLLESRRGQSEAAIAHWRRAVSLDPDDLKTLFSLAREIERLGGADAVAESRRLMDEVLKRAPENLSVLVERARLDVKAGNVEALRDIIARLKKLSAAWPARAQAEHATLEQAAAGTNLRAAAMHVLRLRNLLVTTPAFRQSIADVEVPVGVVGEPFERFIKLPMPIATPSPPDEQLAFTVEPVGSAGPWDTVVLVPLGSEGTPALFAASGSEVKRIDAVGPSLPFPGGASKSPPTPDGVLATDWNSDYLIDLVLAGAGGLRLFRQEADGAFSDVTDAANLAPETRNAAYSGAWAADIDSDGDLDIIAGATEGPPVVLQNSGDGAFAPVQPFEGASQLRQFVWADFNQDGLPDAVLLNEPGRLLCFTNERSGRFRERALPGASAKVVTMANGDLDCDGVIDLVIVSSNGEIARISDEGEGQSWNIADVVRWPEKPGGDTRALVADLDNNGALDLLIGTPAESRAWLGVGAKAPIAAAIPDGFRVFAITELSGDGRLDLAGTTETRAAARATGRGSKDYHWQVVRPRAARNAGDNRINSFGIGGEAEVRAGLLVQKQVINGPTLHFGLGDHEGADVVRVVWPNGTVLAEFNTKPDQPLVAEQRLKGSCPFVFADNGTEVAFVTDFLWRSPLGLRINAQDTAGSSQTEDWIKIRGDQLAPRNGYYDVRITAELWETHYIDHVSLMVVDHPAGTEVFVDERFARDPPALAVHATGPLQPVAAARDDAGRDVTELIRERDGRYLDTFGRGLYQGVTRDHWVEIELGEDTSKDRPLSLVARGWIHPTDSSINVAIAQSRQGPPRGLALEVATSNGEWTVAYPEPCVVAD